jgi:hypothetical protein
MDTAKLTIGYVVLGQDGAPVRTGLRHSKTSKLYKHAGPARAVSSKRPGTIVLPAFIEVPDDA